MNRTSHNELPDSRNRIQSVKKHHQHSHSHDFKTQNKTTKQLGSGRNIRGETPRDIVLSARQMVSVDRESKSNVASSQMEEEHKRNSEAINKMQKNIKRSIQTFGYRSRSLKQSS